MTGYRIVKRRYAGEPLSGKGAQATGGRWNSQGVPMVYAACTLELAALEILVHWSQPAFLPELVAIRFELPDDKSLRYDPRDLKEGWDSLSHYSEETVRIGNEFIQRAEMLYVRVPSVIIPTSYNLLINPSHPSSADIEIETFPFALDTRLTGHQNTGNN